MLTQTTVLRRSELHLARRQRGLVLGVLCGLALGCAVPIQGFQVPVGTPASPPAGPSAATPRYLSAVAFFEHRNVAEWHRKSTFCDGRNHWYCAGDNVLVNAEVSIPSKNRSITTTLPLFLISEGLVESQVGVDLLKKYPIVADARTTASIKLKLLYIRDAGALDKVRGILKAAGEAANALGGEIPSIEIALKVTGSINKVIAGVFDSVDKAKPSSITTMVPTTDEQGGAYLEQRVQAFILAPSEQIAEPEYKNIKPVVACPDLDGALCYPKHDPAQPVTYSKDRVDDYAYITITYKTFNTVYDPLALIDSPQAACDELTKEDVNAARAYVDTNVGLFTPEDVATIRRSAVWGDIYLDMREALVRREYARLMDLVENTLDARRSADLAKSSPHYEPLSRVSRAEVTLRGCVQSLWEASPAREVSKAHALFTKPETGCEGKVSAEACALSNYGVALQIFCDLTGLNLERVLTGEDQDAVRRGTLAPVLAGYVKALIERQEAGAKRLALDKASCQDEGSVGTLVTQSFSPYCTKCRTIILDSCKKLGASKDAIARVLSSSARDRGELQYAASKSLSDPTQAPGSKKSDSEKPAEAPAVERKPDPTHDTTPAGHAVPTSAPKK